MIKKCFKLGGQGMEESMTELQQQIVRFYHHNTFTDHLRMQIRPEKDGQVWLELTPDEIHMNLYGIAHGGVLMSMADTVMGAACLTCNKKVVTMNLSMDFLHAVPMMQKIIGKATVLHDGAHTMACECEIMSEEGKLFAKAHGVFYVIGKFKEEE